MKQKTLLLTKAFVALVAMLFSVNAFAQEIRPYTATLKNTSVDRWTSEIILDVVTNSGAGAIDVATLAPGDVIVENGVGDFVDVVNVTRTAYNATTKVSTLKVEIKPIVDCGTEYAGDNTPGAYLLTFKQGTLKLGSAVENEKFSVLLNVAEDPEVKWSIKQVIPTLLLTDGTIFDYVITAESESASMPTEVFGRTYDGSNKGLAAYNARLEIVAANSTLLADLAGSSVDNKINGTATLTAAQTEAFEITIPAGAYKTATTECPELKLTVKVADYATFKMIPAPGYNNFDETPAELGEYYVQILLNDEPLESTYIGTIPTAANYSSLMATEAASVSGAMIPRIFPVVTPVAGKVGIYHLAFKKVDAGALVDAKIDLTSNSDYLVTFPKITLTNADTTLVNKNVMTTPLTLAVNTDFTFYDTKTKVTAAEELHNVTYQNLTYKRTIPNAYAQPLAVPFDIKAADVAETYSLARLTSVVEEEGVTKFMFTTLKEGETAHALMPYLIKAKKSAGDLEVVLPNTKVTKPAVEYVYTQADADLYNSGLTGAVSTSDKNPNSPIYYTAADAAAYNILLPGAVQYTEVGVKYDPRDGNKFVDNADVDSYNATLPGAKTTASVAGYNNYTAAQAAAKNATLDGARAAGYVEAAYEDVTVYSETTWFGYDFMVHTASAPINPQYFYAYDYGYKALNKNAQFLNVASDATLPAWRWYIGGYKKSAFGPANYIKAEVYIDGEEDATAIDAVNEMIKSGDIYNVNGQKVAAPAKGINIINGKKVLK